MSQYRAEIQEITLSEGKGVYYNDLIDKYWGDKIEGELAEKIFLADISCLIFDSEIQFSDKISILNCLLNAVDRDDVWKLIRLR